MLTNNHGILATFLRKVINSNIVSVLWPINRKDLAKFIPMVILMFSILINQNIIRSIKDSLVITQIGAEVLSFIKLWIEMPLGLLFVIFYTKLCNIYTTEQLFRRIVSAFLIYFILFGFIIFPNYNYLHPIPSEVEKSILYYPHLKWFIKIWAKWSFALFYVIGELWPVVVFSLLYWQLANKITASEEASRFYTLFNLFGQSNLLFSGAIIYYLSSGKHLFSSFLTHANETELAMKSLIIVVVISGIAILAIHYFIEKKIIVNMKDNNQYQTKKEPNGQLLKLNIIDSLRLITKSSYLRLICVLVISYSTSINLIEGLCFYKTKQMYPNAESFMQYQAKVVFLTGCFTLFGSLIGGYIIRYAGWFWAAVISPMMILISGGSLFLSVIFQEQIETFLGYSPLFFIVFIGGLQNVLGKGAKYSLFDATKEMAYIPLEPELKVKGKAAVDIIGVKIGKSSGAIIQFIAFTLFPNISYDELAIHLMIMFLLICFLWIRSVRELSTKYNHVTQTLEI